MVVPTYNEADNLAWIVGRLREAEPDVHVLVVDDSSPDGTGKIADELAAADDARAACCTARRRGASGAAYKHGFQVALDAGYDVIGEMDADGSHQPEQLHLLLDALRDADLVIGSRWVPGGSVVNWPLRRELLSRGGNLYVRLLLGVSGSRRDGRLPGVPAHGAGGDRPRDRREHRLRLPDRPGHRAACRLGLRVREVPIEFVERVRGDSKMSGRVALESLRRVTAWGLRERRDAAERHTGGGHELRLRPDAAAYAAAALTAWVLVAAFVAVPILEIYVIIQVGQVIGAWWTILLLIADSIFGSWLVRREGRRAWQALTTTLQSGRMPATELADGALVLVGGTLMISPGFVTDVFGIGLILPFTRPLARRPAERLRRHGACSACVAPAPGPARARSSAARSSTSERRVVL